MKAELYDLLIEIPHDSQCRLNINGSSYYCKCGCNVFGRFNKYKEIYRCNACCELFESELVSYKDWSIYES